MEAIVKNALINQATEMIQLFRGWDTNFPFKYYSSDLDCSIIHEPDYSLPRNTNPVEGRPVQGYFAPITDEINKLPCLYYLEILNDNLSASEIYDAYIKAADKSVNPSRSFSATRKKFDDTTKVLYVGKVQKGLGGRQVVHLGLYKTGATGGLQMAYWAKQLGLKLRLHFFVAENPQYADYLVPLENRLAKELRPLIGKHK